MPACYYVEGCVNRKVVTEPSGLLQLPPGPEACASFGERGVRLLVTAGSRAHAQFHCERRNYQGLTVVECHARALTRLVLQQPCDALGLALLRYGVLTTDSPGPAEPVAPGQWLYAAAPDQVVNLNFASPQAHWWHLGFSFPLLERYGFKAETLSAKDFLLRPACPELLAFMARSCERYVALQTGDVDPLLLRQLDLLQHLLVVQCWALLHPVAERMVPGAPSDRASTLVAQALLFFEKNYRESITLARVSEFCGVSPRTLQSAFSRAAKGSPMDELHELRLRRLRQQLQLGRSVREACLDVGLVYGGRVSAAYRKLFGELPRETISPPFSALERERA